MTSMTCPVRIRILHGRLTTFRLNKQITAVLDLDASKASFRRTSKVARSTLTDRLAEAAWIAAAIS